MADILRKLETQKNRIVSLAEKEVLRRIQRYCKRYKRTVKTVYGVTVLKGGINLSDGIEIRESQVEKWIYNFEDRFGPFGFYVCENGKFIEGSTPLIKFSKPKL